MRSDETAVAVVAELVSVAGVTVTAATGTAVVVDEAVVDGDVVFGVDESVSVLSLELELCMEDEEEDEEDEEDEVRTVNSRTYVWGKKPIFGSVIVRPLHQPFLCFW